jgi:hypothetical protein
MGSMPLPDPNTVIRYYNDFNTYAAGDWTVNAGGAGSSAAVGAGAGGLLLVTTATSGAESVVGNPAFFFQATTGSAKGNQFWFTTNVTLDATVSQPDYQIGVVKGTMSSFQNETDGVYFMKKTGAVVTGTDTAWNLVIKAAAGATTTIRLPTSTLPLNSAVIQLGFYYDAKPSPTMFVYWNGSVVGTIGAGGSLGTGTSADLTNLPGSTILMGVTYYNGYHTGTSLLSADYVLAACETSRI